MSLASFLSTVRSSDHDFVAALRFLDDYARHVHLRGPSADVVYHHFIPRFDLEQHEDKYDLYGELAGFRREDIIIEAHDDGNLQVSGYLSRLTTQLPSSENEGTGTLAPAKDMTDPPVKVQHQDVPKGEEELNGNQDTSPATKQSNGAPDPLLPKSSLDSTTTGYERYLNGRFGDVQGPHKDGQNGAGTKPEDKEQTPAAHEVRYLISERHPCQFHRAFHFPTPIKKDEVTATMENGILHITAPRAPMPPPVKVTIKNDLPYYEAFIMG